MNRTVVIYSGGVDSTVMLYQTGLKSTKENPIYTLSVAEHHRANKLKMLGQTRTRRRYLAWAKKQGHHIIPEEISISGNAVGNYSLRENFHWATLLAPYFAPGDTVMWGWKKGEDRDGEPTLNFLSQCDEFARQRRHFEPVSHIRPLIGVGQYDLIELARSYKIPKNCMFVCAEPKQRSNGIIDQCNAFICDKCLVMRAIYEGYK